MSTLYYCVYPSNLATPSATQIKQGLDVNNEPAVAYGSEVLTSEPEEYNFEKATGLLSWTSYKVAIVWSSNIGTSNVVEYEFTTSGLEIDWTTGVITVYKNDPFMQLVGSNVYNMDTNAFRLALKDIEDDDDGISYPDITKHNTTVLLGGIEYARIMEILDPYTITFSDIGGSWVCNLLGSNNNILDRTNLTSVQVRSNNSAGLIQMAEIQHNTFNEAVWVDQTNGYSGTTYPIGTPIRPVNNITDANTIAAYRGFNTFRIIGDLILDTGDNVEGKLIIGDNAMRNMIIINEGADTTSVEIRDAAITGVLDGSTIVRQCYVFDLQYVTGFIFQSQIAGTITIGGTMPASFLNCYSATNGVIIDLNGSGHVLNISEMSGTVRLRNKNGSDLCVLNAASATVILDPTITNGTGIKIQGDGYFINESSIEPEYQSLLSLSSISNEVWSKTPNSMPTGGIGEWLFKKVLTIPKFIGLK